MARGPLWLLVRALALVACVNLSVDQAQGAAVSPAGRTVPARTHLGGTIRTVDATHHLIVLVARAPTRVYTLTVTSATQITLNRWPAGYADMQPGDHLTATGTTLSTSPSGAIVVDAQIVRLGSPSFGGRITAVKAVPGGGFALIVQANRRHQVQIDVPPQASVVYGTQAIHASSLIPGLHISVRGNRTGKFELVATAVHAYPHSSHVGGRVVSVTGDSFQIFDAYHRQTVIVHNTGHTVFSSAGRRTTPAAVRVGLHVRVRGTDALSGTPGAPLAVDAEYVVVLQPKVKFHLASLSFGGIIAAVKSAPGGHLLLTIQPKHGHLLQVDVPAQAQVLYSTLAAHVTDLHPGLHVLARGKRVAEYGLVARLVRVYPHTYTIQGTVTSVSATTLVLAVAGTGRHTIVYRSAATTYTLNGAGSRASAVVVGRHVSVHGFDAPHPDQAGVPTMIGTRISVHIAKARPKKKAVPHKAASTTPAPKKTPVPPKKK